MRPHIKYALAWPVSTAIEAAGFRDTYRELHPDPVDAPGLDVVGGPPAGRRLPGPRPSRRTASTSSMRPAPPPPTDVKIVGEVGGPQVDISVEPWGTDHRAVDDHFQRIARASPRRTSPSTSAVTVGDPVIVRYHGAR